MEAIGFDLCENCHESSSKLPGRFNQQHTKDHEFTPIQSPCLPRGPGREVQAVPADFSSFTVESSEEEDGTGSENEGTA